MAEFPEFRFNRDIAQWEKKSGFFTKMPRLPIYMPVDEEDVPYSYLQTHAKAHKAVRRVTSGQQPSSSHNEDSPLKRQRKWSAAGPSDQPRESAAPLLRRGASQQPTPSERPRPPVNKTRRTEFDRGEEFVPAPEQLTQAHQQNADNIRAIAAELNTTRLLIMAKPLTIEQFESRAIRAGNVVQEAMERNQQFELDDERIDKPIRNGERVERTLVAVQSELSVADWYKLVFTLPADERRQLEKTFAVRVEALYKRAPMPGRKPFLNSLGICAYCHVHRNDADHRRQLRHAMTDACPHVKCDCPRCYAMDQVGPNT